MKSYSTSVTKVIRVPIADDHPVFREGLVTILKSENDIKVVAETTDDEEASEFYDQLSPDVLLLDLRMPKKDGCKLSLNDSFRTLLRPATRRCPNATMEQYRFGARRAASFNPKDREVPK